MLVNKVELIGRCLQILEERYAALLQSAEQVREAIVNDDASTAGNKYETSRAMNQAELERLGGQMKQMEIQIAALKLIPLNGSCEVVQKGSLVSMNGMWVLVATAIGRMSWNGLDVSVISPASPLAMQLLGKKPDDEILIAGAIRRIEAIF